MWGPGVLRLVERDDLPRVRVLPLTAVLTDLVDPIRGDRDRGCPYPPNPTNPIFIGSSRLFTLRLSDGTISPRIKRGLRPGPSRIVNCVTSTNATRRTFIMKIKNLAKHTQILLGMILGLMVGAVASMLGGEPFIIDWIKPLGVIFINPLKMIAVPMIITSLIKGVADLGDITQFSKMGLRTVTPYLVTTVVAIAIGLTVVNVIQPGRKITEETRAELVATFQDDAGIKINAAHLNNSKVPCNR